MLEKAPNELPFEHLLRVWALAFDKELPLSKLARIRRSINDLLRNMCPGPITSVDTRSAIALHLAVAVELYPWTNRVIEGVYEGPGGDFIGGAADVATFEDRLDAQGSLILCLKNFVAEYSNGQSVYLAGVLLDPASLEATGVHANIGGAKFYIQEIQEPTLAADFRRIPDRFRVRLPWQRAVVRLLYSWAVNPWIYGGSTLIHASSVCELRLSVRSIFSGDLTSSSSSSSFTVLEKSMNKRHCTVKSKCFSHCTVEVKRHCTSHCTVRRTPKEKQRMRFILFIQ
jgi:hypothetical protein